MRRVASELYELARVGRHDLDSTFVDVRREFLAGLAQQLMSMVPVKGVRRDE